MDEDDNDEGIECPECGSHRIDDAHGGEAWQCMECDHVWSGDEE